VMKVGGYVNVYLSALWGAAGGGERGA
jgi:hypothetical protein